MDQSKHVSLLLIKPFFKVVVFQSIYDFQTVVYYYCCYLHVLLYYKIICLEIMYFSYLPSAWLFNFFHHGFLSSIGCALVDVYTNGLITKVYTYVEISINYGPWGQQLDTSTFKNILLKWDFLLKESPRPIIIIEFTKKL